MVDDATNTLRQALVSTQSPSKDLRKQAEDFLKAQELQPHYAQRLVSLIEVHCGGVTNDDKVIRTLAAVVFKNLIKTKWAPPEDGEGKENCIAEPDKDAIKGNIVPLMCRSPPEVQRQFAEALTIISQHDFPSRWPTLMPSLVELMKSQDYHILNGALLSANSILKRYRYKFKSDALFTEINAVLGSIAAPLLHLFSQSSTALEQHKSNKDNLVLIFEAVRLTMRIFYSLNWQDLPEFFEDSMPQWMEGFQFYLTIYSNPLLEQPAGTDAAGPLERVQAAIVENIRLYTDKYDEEFSLHLPGFATSIWGLLMKVSTGKHHDILATTCIKFLTSVVGKTIHKDMFGAESTLTEIVKNIAVPNVTMRDVDEETFEYNPEDYISGDMEGGDNETRRRGACDLVRGMCKQFEEKTTKICSEFVVTMLQEYTVNPAVNWKAKDAAIQLLLALAVRAQSHVGGVSKINPYMNIMDIFSSNILPEIQDPDVNARPIVRADCLKFVYTFRNQFTVEHLSALMPLLITHLGSEHAVVQTYAAMTIERFLVVKDKREGQRPVNRFGKDRLAPFLEPLFAALFKALDEGDDGENDNMMKAVMRALDTAQELVVPVTQIVLTKLNGYLQKVCKNPSKPRFNHFLFESIAVLVQGCLKADPSTARTLEAALFPPFQQILVDDVVEFVPYVFQILAQIMELRPAEAFSSAYEALFPMLLMPVVWERKGNVPAVTRLLQSYMSRDAKSVVQWGHLNAVLAVFQKLLSSRANEAYAFALLGTVVQNLDGTQLEQYLWTIFQLLFVRLKQNKNVKYIRFLTIFFSIFIVKRGVPLFSQCLSKQQAGMLEMILVQVWIPNFENRLVFDLTERKVQVVGMTNLLCESPEVQANGALWSGLLKCILAIVAPEDGKEAKGDDAVAEPEEEEEDDIAFDSAFSKLRMAGSGRQDPVPEVPSDTIYLAQKLGALCTSQPGKYPPLITAALVGKENGAKALSGYLAQAGVSLI